MSGIRLMLLWSLATCVHAQPPERTSDGLLIARQPAVRMFAVANGAQRMGGNASWPASRPAPQWVESAHLHFDLEQTRIENGRLRVEAMMWSSRAVDTRRCVLEITRAPNVGVQVGAPTRIEPQDAQLQQTFWDFVVPMPTQSLAAIEISAYAFCPDEVMLYTGWSPVLAGPQARAVICARPRPPPQHGYSVSLEGSAVTAVLVASCGTLLRRRGDVVVDACEPATPVMNLASLGVSVTGLLPMDAPFTEAELAWALSRSRTPPRSCEGEPWDLRFDHPIGDQGAAQLQHAVTASPALDGVWSRDGMSQP